MVQETTQTPGSSNIEQFAFDPDTDTLTVTFRNGDEYDYFNVPPATYRAMQAAPSAGQFLNRHVKGRFSYDGPK